MTSTEMKTATKAALTAYIEQLQATQNQTKQELTNAINLANYFGAILMAIETLLNKSPFISKEGKFMKKLFWVFANFNTIISLVEEIVTKIKEWRSKVDDIIAQQKAQQEAAPTA